MITVNDERREREAKLLSALPHGTMFTCDSIEGPGLTWPAKGGLFTVWREGDKLRIISLEPHRQFPMVHNFVIAGRLIGFREVKRIDVRVIE